MPRTIQAVPVAITVALNGNQAGGGGTTDPPVTDPIALVLSSPGPGETVATATPELIVAAEIDETDVEYTIEVQVATDNTFTTATTFSETFDATDGGVSITPSSPLPATTYWRARILQGTTRRSDWTAPSTFTINTTITAVLLAVTWTVNATAPRPIHLWHFFPPGPDAGDLVTAYGQGFPASGHLDFNGAALPVVSWTRVDEQNTASPGRAISSELVDAEHYEVTFHAPAYDGPGAPLTVTE